jgi:monovalent cation:H+ antiporter, CPA1 family
MSLYHVFLSFFILAVAIAYINQHIIKMQRSIALLAASLLSSIIIILLNKSGYSEAFILLSTEIHKINFQEFLLQGVLSFMLFAGALSINLKDLAKNKWEIILLSSISTIGSAFLVGYASYYLLPLLHIELPLIYCLLFGALISPTDPIAVLSIIKQLRAPKDLETIIAGESLFNDGVGIVIFLTLYQVAFSGAPFEIKGVGLLFLQQAIGGLVFGYLIGLIAYYLIKQIEDHHLEILITLAIPTAGYCLADLLKVSGPLAMVVAGILVSNKSDGQYFSKLTREHLPIFWETIDEILNAVLFLLIGLQVFNLDIHKSTIFAGLFAIPLVLLIRLITVLIPIQFFKRYKSYNPFITSILTWGGLRGGLAIAMALLIPASSYQSIILTITYCIVVFAILVQGTTAKYLIAKSL